TACDTGSRRGLPGAGGCSASITPSSSPSEWRGFFFFFPPTAGGCSRPGPFLRSRPGPGASLPALPWVARPGVCGFLFSGGRAVGGWMPRPEYLAVAMLAQAGYLFPWIWIPLVVLLVHGCRRWPGLAEGPERLWLCVAALPLAAFTAVACFRPVLPHWGLIGL